MRHPGWDNPNRGVLNLNKIKYVFYDTEMEKPDIYF
jgi:hypothetical protein